MIKPETYNQIKKKYGKSASWAVWAEEGRTPKSNISDLSIFNDSRILKILNPNYVFVGLNPSVQDTDNETWRNFHSVDNKKQHDYKLRYALKNTKFWGAYITDVVPDKKDSKAENVSESSVYRHLKLAYMNPHTINEIMSGKLQCSVDKLFNMT